MSLSPAAVMGRLEEIEIDMAERQNDYEEAAEELKRADREWKKREAQTYLTTDKKLKVDDRKSATLLALAASDDGIYERVTDAEAAFESQKAALGVLEKRASIGQSILRALTQESFGRGAQPQWSKAAA